MLILLLVFFAGVLIGASFGLVVFAVIYSSSTAEKIRELELEEKRQELELLARGRGPIEIGYRRLRAVQDDGAEGPGPAS